MLGTSLLSTEHNPYLPPTLPDPYITGDVLQFSFQGVIPLPQAGVIDWFAGRRLKQDLTGKILNSRLDGVGLGWYTGRQHFSLQGYYTGLVGIPNSQITMSSQDYLNEMIYYTFGNPFLFQPTSQRLIGLLDYSVSQIFLHQNFSAELLGQYDLGGAGTLHTTYLTLELTGPVDRLTYRFYVTGSALIGPLSTSLSALAGFHASWQFPSQWQLFTDGIYTTRLTPGAGDGFLPITLSGPSDVLTSLTLWNIAKVSLGISSQPLTHMSCGVKLGALFQTTEQNQNSSSAVSDAIYQPYVPYLNAAYMQPYLGSEASLFGSWNPTSEWSFATNLAGFLPYSLAFTDSHWEWLAALSVNLKI